jgi:hypothetical protein
MFRTTALRIGLVVAAFDVVAAPSAELLDLAGRVHYGYYNDEPRAIDAAIAALDRLPDSPEVAYYRDFAALRRAQLGNADRSVQQRLRRCTERDVPAYLDKRFAAEAWTLVAACAHVASDEDRREQALSYARDRDDDNPRITLVEAWSLEAAGTDATQRDAIAVKLEAVVAAFDEWAPSVDDPGWGHAESLTTLAALALRRGQTRAARDLIERALLLVPDYRAALDLRAELQRSAATGRSL